jgi:hypothetical protein
MVRGFAELEVLRIGDLVRVDGEAIEGDLMDWIVIEIGFGTHEKGPPGNEDHPLGSRFLGRAAYG